MMAICESAERELAADKAKKEITGVNWFENNNDNSDKWQSSRSA
jgi:hypothetical protein